MGLAQHRRSGSTGRPGPQNPGGIGAWSVLEQKICNIYQILAKYDQGYYDRLIGCNSLQ